MSDVEIVLSAYPRIHFACRARRVRIPGRGDTLTAHQVTILSSLDAVDPTMVTELAEHLGVTPSTMSLNLKRLQSKGFIRRERDPQDRRVMNVVLTEDGKRVRDAQTVLDTDRVDAMLRELDPARRQEAVRGLALLADASDALVRRGKAYVEALIEGGEL